MAEARAGEAWNHTSAVLAMIANANRDPKKSKVFRPGDFHPYAGKRKRGIPITAANIQVLKRLAGGKQANQRGVPRYKVGTHNRPARTRDRARLFQVNVRNFPAIIGNEPGAQLGPSRDIHPSSMSAWEREFQQPLFVYGPFRQAEIRRSAPVL